jgi:hypothetical protein
MLEIERKCLWRIEEHEKMINQKVIEKKKNFFYLKYIFFFIFTGEPKIFG